MSVATFFRAGAAVLGAVLMIHAARAADLYGYKDQPYPPPPPPLPIWQGYYIGADIGIAWSTIEPAANLVFLGSSPGTVLVNRDINDSGIFGGIHGGYNVQYGNLLYGIEADIGGMDIGGKGTFVDASTPARTLQISGNSGWYGDVTARGGVLFSNVLLYVKGGFAFFTGDVRATDNFDSIRQNSGTFTGGTIGVGFEYMINPSWTLKFEYMYFDFGNNNFSCCSGVGSGRIDSNLTVDTFKIGFNVLLRPAYTPLY
jgi:outer membrane immunogenic protein